MAAIIVIMLGLASVGYGLTVKSRATDTRFWMVWETIGIVLAIAGLVWRLDGMLGLGFVAALEQLPSGLLFAIRIVVIAGFALLICLNLLILTDFNDKGESNLDFIIVLGAQILPTGPSKVLAYRLKTAQDYLEKNPRTKCIVSGGMGANEHISEARGMRNYLVEHGIDEDRIILEDGSTNTTRNLRYSKMFVDAEHDRVGVVTNNFHLYRGVHIGKKCGYRNICGIAAGSTSWYLPNNMLRESMGILKDLLAGNLSL